MTSVMPVRALVGVAALTTALGLGVVAPGSASASTVSRSTVATTALPTLVVGSKGVYVTSVQRVLAIRPTGVYDRATYLAVRRLQAWKRLAPTGVVGSTTWVAMHDSTLTRTMRISRAARAKLPYAVWLASVHGRSIAYRESTLRCTALSRTGIYRGKWQMTLSLWRAYGGRAYAATPEKASCAAQDKVAHAIWVAGGWSPWGG